MPPVANIFIPQICAQIKVPETVVPPFNRCPSTYGKSRRDVLTTLVLPSASSTSSLCDNPILIRPFKIATVAGIAPYYYFRRE